MARLRHRSKSQRSRTILGASRPARSLSPEAAVAPTPADAEAAEFVAAIERVLGELQERDRRSAASREGMEGNTADALAFADLVESVLPQASLPEGLEQPNVLGTVSTHRPKAAAESPDGAVTGALPAAVPAREARHAPAPVLSIERQAGAPSLNFTSSKQRQTGVRVLAAAAMLLLTVGASVLVWQGARDGVAGAAQAAPAMSSNAAPPPNLPASLPDAPASTPAQATTQEMRERPKMSTAAEPSIPPATATPRARRSVSEEPRGRAPESPAAPPASRAASVERSSPVPSADVADALVRSEPASAAGPEPTRVAEVFAPRATPAPPSVATADEEAEAAEMERMAAARERAVQRVVSAYERAYDSRSVSAVAEIWPSLDAAGFSRAFNGVREQDLSFDECVYTVEDARAVARCPGRVRYVGRVGRTEPQVREAVWTITMARVNDDWQVADLNVR